MTNIINFTREEVPKDLMTFKEVEKVYKIKYDTLYKWTCLDNKITYYSAGGLKVSERDIINWIMGSKVTARC